MTFMDDYHRGEVGSEDIEDYIDVWHAKAAEGPFGPKLHQFLGLTWEQYKTWGETGELPPRDVEG